MAAWPFLLAGVYGVALCLLISSWHVTPWLMRRFVSDDYALGSHGQVWADWHAIGCLFVGIVNLMVYFGDFNAAAATSIAVASAIIYTIWCLQNLRLVLVRPALFKTPMWLNVILCGVAAVASTFAAVNAG